MCYIQWYNSYLTNNNGKCNQNRRHIRIIYTTYKYGNNSNETKLHYYCFIFSAEIQIKAQHACKDKSIYIEVILFYNNRNDVYLLFC